MYHKALSANPAEAQAAIIALQNIAKSGGPEATDAENTLEALVPVLQGRAEAGLPNALEHLGLIATAADSSGASTSSANAAVEALFECGVTPPVLVLQQAALANNADAFATLVSMAENGDRDAFDALFVIYQDGNPEFSMIAHTAIVGIRAQGG